MGVQAGDIEYRIGVTGEKNLDRSLGKGQKWGAAMTVAGAAVVGVLGKATAEAVTFGEKVGNVATLGVTDLGKLKDGAKDVAMTIGTDVNDAMSATYDILSAGVPEGNAVEFLEKSAIAAKAGVGELSDAVDLGTSVMNGFGKSAGDVGNIFNQSQMAIKLGKTNISQMGAAVGKVAPLFKGTGVASEEMFASIAKLTQGGIVTAEAVTGLKATLVGILKPTSDAKKAAKELGIGFDSEALASKGLVGVLQEVWDKTDGNIDQLGRLFSSQEAQIAVMALMGDGGAGLADVLDQVANSQGSVDDAYAAFMEANPADKFHMLQQTIKVLAIELGEALLPALINMAEVFTPIVRGMAEWMAEHPKLTTGIVTVVGAMGALGVALGPILMLLPGITSAMGLFGGASAAAGVGGFAAAGGVTAFLTAALPIAAVLAVAGVAIWKVTESYMALQEEKERLLITEQQLEAMQTRRLEQLDAEGVAVDQNLIKKMNADEVTRHMNRVENQERDTTARQWFEYYAGRTETETEFSQMRNLMLNENISAEQAAQIVSKNLAAEKLAHVMRGTEKETAAFMKAENIKQSTAEETQALITGVTLTGAAERQNAWENEGAAVVDSQRRAEKEARSVWVKFFEFTIRNLELIGTMGTSKQSFSDSMFGSNLPTPPGKETGGAVMAGHAYEVGERGRELFIPETAGTIVPNSQAQSFDNQNNAPSINIVINEPHVMDSREVQMLADRIGETVGQQLRQGAML